jgi:multidrug efflux pump subunit AcrB
VGRIGHALPVFVPISLAVSLFVAYAFTPYLVKKILKGKK